MTAFDGARDHDLVDQIGGPVHRPATRCAAANDNPPPAALTWRQRVEIGFEVAAGAGLVVLLLAGLFKLL